MLKDDFHRLLRRQIKNHLGDINAIHPNLENFLQAINLAYKDYDKDIEHVERIFKQSSQELFKSNKELNFLNNQNEKIIEEKTSHLKKITFNLQNAEKLAGLGNFSWNIKSKNLELSEQLIDLCKLYNVKKNSTILELLGYFENSHQIQLTALKAIRTKTKFRIENIKIKNDPRYYVLEGMFLDDVENDDISLLGIFQDVTEIKLHELEIKETLETLEYYKNAIDNSGIVSKTDEHGFINYVNDKFCEVSGYSAEELLGKQHNIINSGYHSKEFFNEMWQTISNGKIWKGVFRNKSKNGNIYWVDSTIVPFLKNGKIFSYISIRFDITEKMVIHQKVEEQKMFYETILNSIPVDIAVFNENHEYLYLNPMAVKSPSVREFLIGKDDFDYCQHYNKDISIAQTRREIFKEVKNLKKTIEFTDKILQPNGNYVYNLRRFFPILNESNEFVNMIGFGIDITEKTEQALQLENSLEEKEALLGEIHHRVKNNLALVLGLIEMQSIRTENDYLKNQFSEIHNRISAMSLIHEKLYKSTNFAKVDLKDYLQDLVKYLSGFFNKGKNVKLNFELEQIFASTKKAVPIALIVNELITNCFKYAFKEIDNGEIFVKLTKFGGETILTISDNGPGIPEDLNISKSNSLGFKLLNIFTKQLKGSCDFKNSPGLTITIKFKDEQEGFNS